MQQVNPLDALNQAPIVADPTKVREAIGKLDFMQAITPDVIGKIQTGTPEEAASNLAAIVNAAVRQAVTGVTLSQSELVNNALAKQRDAFTAALPGMLRRQQLEDTPVDDPILSHPAAQPLVTAMKRDYLSRNPNASAVEVNKKVTEYLRGLSSAVAGDPQKAAKQAAANATQDWDSWFNE